MVHLTNEEENRINSYLKEIQSILQSAKKRSDESPEPTNKPKPNTEVYTSPDRKCPNCGSPLVARLNRGKNEFFWGCPKFPDCRHAEAMAAEEQLTATQMKEDRERKESNLPY